MGRTQRTLWSIVIVTLLATPHADATRSREALEQFELTKLRIAHIGKPKADGSRLAYIQDPAGYVHLVQPGSYVGKRDGRILEIRQQRILISELVPDGDGYREKVAILECDASCRDPAPPAQSKPNCDSPCKKIKAPAEPSKSVPEK